MIAGDGERHDGLILASDVDPKRRGESNELRKRAACRQTLADQVDQGGIVQQCIDGIEQIVFKQGSLTGQRGVEE
jgi:hypothetical protein